MRIIRSSIYNPPPLNLLSDEASSEKKMKSFFLEKLFEKFGIGITVTNVYISPAITRYEVKPKPGVRLSEIYDFKEDLEYQLTSWPVRIEKATPDNPIIGIEVPNENQKWLYLKEILDTDDVNRNDQSLNIPMGIDTKEKIVSWDLRKSPHLLIGGSTGSGKSMFISSLITSILYKYSPYDVQLILADPKIVELSVYNGIPHLLFDVITNTESAFDMLKWAEIEVKKRYSTLSDQNMSNIYEYNKDKPKKMPHIIIIIDELADLMMNMKNEIEDMICRLVQIAGGVGIHLIISTQMLSDQIITGIIRANIPDRVSFAVSNKEESEIILGEPGAEELIGRGDMLYFPQYSNRLLRIQSPFVTNDDVKKVIDYLKHMPVKTTTIL